MNIYVGNLSYETTEEDLKEAFKAFGEVNSVRLIKDKYTDRSKGFGFVEMPDEAQAKSAIEGLNEKDLKGRNLKVNEARERTEGRRGGSGFGGGGFKRGGGGFGGGSRGGGGGRGGGRRRF